MTIQKAMEILGLNNVTVDMLTEEILKKAYRKKANETHPDIMGPIIGEKAAREQFQEVNAANEELLKYVKQQNAQKDQVDYQNYISKIIFDLEQIIVYPIDSFIDNPNVNNVVNNIKKIIDTLKLFTNIHPNDISMFDAKYNEALDKINKEINNFRSNLLNDLEQKYVIKGTKSEERFRIHEKDIKNTDNIFDIYNLYLYTKKQMTDFNKKIPISTQYVAAKIDKLKELVDSKGYDKGNKISEFYYSKLHSMVNSLYKNWNNANEFEEYYRKVEDNIKKVIANYYTNLLDSLKNMGIYTKIPAVRNIFADQKLTNYAPEKADLVIKMYEDTKQKMVEGAKNYIKVELEKEVLDKYTNKENYEFVAPLFKNDFNKIINNVETVFEKYDKDKIIKTFESSVSGSFKQYRNLIVKKDMIVEELQKFGDNPENVSLLEQLKNTKEYDKLEKLVNNASDVLKQISTTNRVDKASQIDKFIEINFHKLNTLSREVRSSYYKIFDKINDLLKKYEKGEINLDLEVFKQMTFTDIEKDSKLVEDAIKPKKEEETKTTGIDEEWEPIVKKSDPKYDNLEFDPNNPFKTGPRR